MTITAVLIDDEESARATLVALLSAYCPEVQVVAEVESVADGLEAIQQHQPGIVFLDVQMPRQNGFHLLDRIAQPPGFEIIFTTAYDQYALRAIRAGAADYLLKPVDILELQDAVNRVLERVKNRTQHPGWRVIAENQAAEDLLTQKLTLPTADGFFVARYQEIVRCEADRNYTWFYLRNGRKILVSKTLKTFEELLPEVAFMRVHKSHIINLNEVIRYSRGNTGIIEMSDGAEIDISRNKKQAFLTRMNQ